MDAGMSIEELYRRASDGDTDAMVGYADCLIKGVGCEPDPKGAVQCLETAVKDNNAAACVELGKCYTYGTGVEKNDSLATEYYRKGAQLGNADAMYRLFQNLSVGVGGKPNLGEADRWLQTAADNGNAKARRTLQQFENSGMRMEDFRKMTRNMQEADKRSHAVTMQNGDEEGQTGGFDPSGIRVNDKKIGIASQTYVEPKKTKGAAALIAIYIIIGAICGFNLRNALADGKSVMNMNRLYHYTSSLTALTVYLTFLGIGVGLLMGLLLSRKYKTAAIGILYFVPLLFIPLIVAIIAPPFMPIIIGFGQFLKGLAIVVGVILAIACVGYSSSNG